MRRPVATTAWHPRTHASTRARRRFRPAIEPCEGRALPSGLYIVDSLGDTGSGSGGVGDLRYAITQADANPASTIIFAITGTIQLASALPEISTAMTIEGLGANELTVNGGGPSSNYSDFQVAYGGIATISGLTISGGHDLGGGGGIANGGALSLNNCAIVDNTTTSSGREISAGGGIVNYGTLDAAGCTISGNSADLFGGGLANLSGTVVMANCTIASNSAGDYSAGQPGYGGGLYTTGGSTTLVNCTVTDNYADFGTGAGISNDDQMSNPSDLTLDNTLVEGNFDFPNPSTGDVSGPIDPASGYNFIVAPDTISGISNGTNGNHVGSPGDPLDTSAGFGSLANNGGPTETIAEDPGNGTSLNPGSPTIDAGSDALAVDPITGQPLTTDQRGAGYSRIAGSGVDIGAYEYQAPPPAPSLALDPTSDSSHGHDVTYIASPLFDVGGIAPQATAVLYRNGVEVDSVQSPLSGTATLLLTDEGPGRDGTYTYTATQVDSSGVASPASASLVVVIKTSTATPTLALDPASAYGPVGGDTTISRTPTLTGTADPGASIALVNASNGAAIGGATANSSGLFTVTPASPLADGTYSLQVRSEDLAGNVGTSSPLTVTITTVAGDFTGSGAADPAIFRRTSPGELDFYIRNATPPGGTSNFGAGSLDVPLQGDLDGDGKDDLILYRPSSGTWYIRESSGPTFTVPNFGTTGDIPVVADFTGSGHDEIGVYRPSTGTWYVQGIAQPVAFPGVAGFVPVPGRYNNASPGDQFAIYNPSSGEWLVENTSQPAYFGGAGFQAVPGDYIGTGYDQLAVYQTSTATWYIAGMPQPIQFGGAGDIPAPADYTGGGKDDLAVYRPSTGQWFITGIAQPIQFGGPADTPLASPYAYHALPGTIGAQSVSADDAALLVTAPSPGTPPSGATQSASSPSSVVAAVAVAPARARPNQDASRPDLLRMAWWPSDS